MNPTDIYEALDAIAKVPFDPAEFGFSFAEATDNAQATVSKLRGGSLNRSDIEGGVLMNLKFHFAPADALGVEATLDALKGSKRTAKHKPAILIATDGETVAVEHWKSGERLHCAFSEIGDHFGFFLPAAGKDRYRPAEENPIDVKATGKLAKLYDALTKANPDWATDARRHDMNQFMTRLIFCMFAEDVGIFPENQFSRAIFTHAGDKGEEAHGVLISAFQVMNLPKNKRADLPAWSQDLEYVNGGLFAGTIDSPRFDAIAFRYLREACDLDWKEINPDIFGSMIQSVADPKARAELGMHYTSVPNIMKVLGPLFLDELDTEIDKAWDRPNGLRKVLDRMSVIRVFDPACGSGNFLVVAYRELRAREIRILRRLSEIEGQAQIQMWSQIPITNFYGIEITDFSAETAKLAMFIAEYQANAMFGEAFGRKPAALPLKGGASVLCGNALRVDWASFCPNATRDEVYIAGNPPYLGGKKREAWQTDDMRSCGLEDVLLLDYVTAWFFKAQRYSPRAFAFVATSSICQGEQVAPLWSRLFRAGLSITFGHMPFQWRNSAADNAGVWVVIVGLRNQPRKPVRLFDQGWVGTGSTISPYLFLGAETYVAARSTPLSALPEIVMGSNPVDGKRLVVSAEEKNHIVNSHPEAERFIRPYLGGDEILGGKERFCVWVDDDAVEIALACPPIADRIRACGEYRKGAGRDARRYQGQPHRFAYRGTVKDLPCIGIPNSQSSKRPYLPTARVPAGTVVSKEAFAIYTTEDWVLAILSSRMHQVWLATVGGRIGNGFRYSGTLVYNTFPLPGMTDGDKEELAAAGRNILKARYANYPLSLDELYSEGNFPNSLAKAHDKNDKILENLYAGKTFANDAARRDMLMKLYSVRAAKRNEEAA